MKSLKKPLIYVALALVPMLFSKCTLSEDFAKLQSTLKDSVQIYVGTPDFNTLAHLQFVDAATNLPLENQDVKVALSGKDAGSMYNNMGKQMGEYTGKWGMLDLVLDPHKTDVSSLGVNPVEFIVTPKLTGYVGVPQRVLLLNSGTNNDTIRLINLSSPPPGYYSSTNVALGNTNPNGQISGSSTPVSLVSRKFSKNSSQSADMRGYFWFLNNTTLLDALGNILIGKVTCDYTLDGVSPWYVHSAWSEGSSYENFTYPYFSLSMQLYVESVDGVKTAVSNFGNKGGIIFHKALDGYMNGGRVATVGSTIDRWRTESLLNDKTHSFLPSEKDTVKDNVLTLYTDNAIGLNVKFTDIRDLNSTWGYVDYYRVVNGTFNINGKCTQSDAYAEYATQYDGNNSYYNGSLKHLYLDLYNPTGSKQITCNYLTHDSNLPNYPDYFVLGYVPTTFGLTILPLNFSVKPDLNSPNPNFTQDILIQENPTKEDEILVAIDLSVVNSSNKNLVIKPNVNIQVGSQACKLINGKSIFKVKIGDTYVVRGVFGTYSGEGALHAMKMFNQDGHGGGYITINTLFSLPIGNSGELGGLFVVPDNSKVVYMNYSIPVSDNVFNQMKQ